MQRTFIITRGRSILLLVLFCFAADAFGQQSKAAVAKLLQSAREAGKTGDFGQAIRLYHKVLETKPHWLPAEFDLALSYYFTKQYPDAIPLFDDVIKRDPAVPNAYLFRGLSYYQINGYTKALDSLNKILEVQPKNAQALFYIGSSHYELSDYAQAALAYLRYVDS